MHRLVVAIIALVVGAGSAFAQGTDDLARRAIERRAVEAVIWGMPAVNYRPDAAGDAHQDRRRSRTRSSTGRGRATGRTRR